MNNTDNIDKLKIGDHTLLLYEDESEMISRSISFIRESLKRGEKCLYIEGDADIDFLMFELRKLISGIDKYLKNGQLQILSRAETYALSKHFKADKMIDLLKKESLKALKEGHNGLSITGELSWVLDFEDGKEELIKYEWKLNEDIFGSYPVVAMCRYNINKFDDVVIKAVIELHHYIIWKGKAHENPYYIPPEGYRDNKVTEYEISSWLKNIQEYKKRESVFKERLKEKENEYEFLFNKINDAVYLHEIDDNNEFGNFIKVNDKACEMVDYSREELLDMSPRDIDSPEIVEKARKQVVNVIPFENEIIVESEHITSSGSVFPVELNVSYYESKGKSYLLTIARDITERKKKEKELLNAKESLQIKNEMLEANNEEIRAMNESLDHSVKELNELNKRYIKMIDLFSNKTHLNYADEESFLKELLKTGIEVIPEANYGSVYTYQKGKVNFIDCIGYNLNELEKIDIPAESFFNQKEDIEIINLEEIKKRNKKHMNKIEFEKLTKHSYKMKEIMYMDLEVMGKKRAGLSLDIDANNKGNFTDNSLKTFKAFQNMASIFYSLDNYYNLQKTFTKELVTSIVKLLEMYDLYTKGHSENVANLASQIAEQMGLSQKRINEVYWSGLVHDIGKLLILLDVLNKKTKLNDKEYELIKKHPVWGSQALEGSDSLKPISEYIRYHHERWDGRGYPDGLSKDDIPLVSQILQVADSWDAMISKRAYRDALNKEEALRELEVNRETQFSPKVVDIFLQMK
jgi:PAS domain S-box-containing protein